MAKRRMFSTEFLQSDNFSDLPFSCQVLYFNLMAGADDDGFISGPRRIMRGCTCREEDLKYLVKAGYLIVFDSGIAVIRHWLIHNHIRKDRHTETIFAAEKAKLELKDGVYEWRDGAKENQINRAESVKPERNNGIYKRHEDVKEKSAADVENTEPESVCFSNDLEELSECPQPLLSAGDHHSRQIQSVTVESVLPKSHYFDDTQVNLLFQAFLCRRNEKTGRWDDPESIQKMVDELSAFTTEHQKKLLLEAIEYGRKDSNYGCISQSVTEDDFSASDEWTAWVCDTYDYPEEISDSMNSASSGFVRVGDMLQEKDLWSDDR